MSFFYAAYTVEFNGVPTVLQPAAADPADYIESVFEAKKSHLYSDLTVIPANYPELSPQVMTGFLKVKETDYAVGSAEFLQHELRRVLQAMKAKQNLTHVEQSLIVNYGRVAQNAVFENLDEVCPQLITPSSKWGDVQTHLEGEHFKPIIVDIICSRKDCKTKKAPDANAEKCAKCENPLVTSSLFPIEQRARASIQYLLSIQLSNPEFFKMMQNPPEPTYDAKIIDGLSYYSKIILNIHSIDDVICRIHCQQALFRLVYDAKVTQEEPNLPFV